MDLQTRMRKSFDAIVEQSLHNILQVESGFAGQNLSSTLVPAEMTVKLAKNKRDWHADSVLTSISVNSLFVRIC